MPEISILIIAAAAVGAFFIFQRLRPLTGVRLVAMAGLTVLFIIVAIGVRFFIPF